MPLRVVYGRNETRSSVSSKSAVGFHSIPLIGLKKWKDMFGLLCVKLGAVSSAKMFEFLHHTH